MASFLNDISNLKQQFNKILLNSPTWKATNTISSNAIRSSLKDIVNKSTDQHVLINYLVYLIINDCPLSKFVTKVILSEFRNRGVAQTQVIDNVKATYKRSVQEIKDTQAKVGDFITKIKLSSDSTFEPTIEVIGWARRRPNDGPFRLVAYDTRVRGARYIRYGKYDRNTKTYQIAINSAERSEFDGQPLFDTVDQAMNFAQNLTMARTARDVFKYNIRITSQFNHLPTLQKAFKNGDYKLVNTSCGPAYIYKYSLRFVESKSHDDYLDNNTLLEWADELQDDDLDSLWYGSSDEEVMEEDIEVHNELNPKLFDENNLLKNEVREKIEQIVTEFCEQLAEDEIKIAIDDIILVGSNVSYNYTKDSDLDIHIIANTKNFECPDNLYPKLYSAYRSLFNKKHNIDFYGIPVELYVETEDSALVSNGIYSVRNNKWIQEPTKEKIPEIDQAEFDSELQPWIDRYEEIVDDLKSLTESVETEKIDSYIDDIYALRKKSIAEEGEYGIGNLIFKEIRNLGYLDELKDLRIKVLDNELSIK